MQLTNRILITNLLCALWLTGCVTPPLPKVLQPDTGAATSQPVSPVPQAELDRASELELMGDHVAAAALYQSLAMRMPPPYRQDLQLRAVAAFLLAQDTESAGRLLRQTDVSGLSPVFDLRKRIQASELAIRGGNLKAAFSLLEAQPPEGISTDLRQRYHRQRAEILRLEGNLLESAHELAQLDLLISDPAARLHNQQAILQTLATLTDSALRAFQPDPPGQQGGWMELARIIKGYEGDPASTQVLLTRWRERFPLHPAQPELLEGYRQRLQSQYRQVKNLAILLPQTGALAGAAAALRNGIMAAYYQLPLAKRPQLRFYDSSNAADTWPLYRQAVDAGADMVIGPLNKSAVLQLARAGELEIPVLALNQIAPQMGQPENLFQFGLSPEDEARQVAERAWQDGLSEALAIVPEGSWGERILNSFRERWEALGGTLLEAQTYDAKGQDFSRPVLTLLDIDESKARRSEIQRILIQNVKYEPRRRQDVDFIFFAAKPEIARQIRPLLQFHHAADIPVYATSHLYAGSPDAMKDGDLEGVKFPDIPWLLASEKGSRLSRDALAALFPGARRSYQRLYAMGIDSFNLLPHLGRLKVSPWETLDGQTGSLYLDEINQVHRRLMWAQMRRGVPYVLGYAPRIESGLTTPGDDLPPLIFPTVVPAPPIPLAPPPAPAAPDRSI